MWQETQIDTVSHKTGSNMKSYIIYYDPISECLNYTRDKTVIKRCNGDIIEVFRGNIATVNTRVEELEDEEATIHNSL